MTSFSQRIGDAIHNYEGEFALINSKGEHWSYKQLSQEVELVKNVLLNNGLAEGSRVGLYANKSRRLVAVILACLELKMCYVPVGVDTPSVRALDIFNQAEVNLIYADNGLSNKLDLNTDPIHSFSESVLIPFASVKHEYSEIAYILFTSGSTGSPKGVVILESHALAFIEWTIKEFNIDANDRLSSIAPFHFDLSIFDLFAGIFSQSTVVLYDQMDIKNPRLLAKSLIDNKVNVMYTTPTILNLLKGFGKIGRYQTHDIRLVLFAGEVFPPKDLEEMMSICKNAAFYNLYGPTETNVVTYYKVPSGFKGTGLPVPIGNLCPYAKAKIVKDEILDLESGIQGELWIGGDSVFREYLKANQLNETKLQLVDSERWYKSGDMVSVNSKMEICFVGREDRMIKRNGYRIELGEIENGISHSTLIESNVVVAVEKLNRMEIVAILVESKGKGRLNSVQFNEHCLNYLPQYMLPDRIVYVEQIPMTPSHKVDYIKIKNGL